MLYSSFFSSSIFYTTIKNSKSFPFPFWFMQIIFIITIVMCVRSLLYIFRFRHKELFDLIETSKKDISNKRNEIKILEDDIEKYIKELKELK